MANDLLSQFSLWFSTYKFCNNADQIQEKIEELTKEHMPSGSGFNAGTTFNFEESTQEKLVFDTSYQHMNEVGYYDGWTEHKVVVTPSFLHGFLITVTGRDKNEIKEYILDVFASALDKTLEPTPTSESALTISLEALKRIRDMCPATCDMTVAHTMAEEADTAIKAMTEQGVR